MTARDGFRNHGRAAGLTFHFRRRWRAIADNCGQLRAPLARRRAGEHQPAGDSAAVLARVDFAPPPFIRERIRGI